MKSGRGKRLASLRSQLPEKLKRLSRALLRSGGEDLCPGNAKEAGMPNLLSSSCMTDRYFQPANGASQKSRVDFRWIGIILFCGIAG